MGHDGIGLLYSFQNNNSQEIQWKEFTASTELEKITTFYIKDNKVWIGTKQNGLMSVYLDKKNQQIKDYIHYDYFSRDRINAIIPYRDNQLFMLRIMGSLSSMHRTRSL